MQNLQHNFWKWECPPPLPPVWTMFKKTALFLRDGFPYGLGCHQSLRLNIKFLSPAIRVCRNIIAGFVSQWLWLFDAIAQSPLVLNMLAGGRVHLSLNFCFYRQYFWKKTHQATLFVLVISIPYTNIWHGGFYRTQVSWSDLFVSLFQTKWASEWVSERVSEWVSEWVSERVSEWVCVCVSQLWRGCAGVSRAAKPGA